MRIARAGEQTSAALRAGCRCPTASSSLIAVAKTTMLQPCSIVLARRLAQQSGIETAVADHGKQTLLAGRAGQQQVLRFVDGARTAARFQALHGQPARQKQRGAKGRDGAEVVEQQQQDV